ncbi:MAG TPA: hypothetical protein VMT62_16145 [Syntrophorhabdaceae bacterium]|nr:hypothetical protein [Syntrophorhabdaceae bacterium]
MQAILKFFQDMFLDLWDYFQDVYQSILVMVFIMLIGFVFSWLVKKILSKLLVLFRFDKWAEEAGIINFLEKGGVKTPPSLIVSKIVYWIFIVFFLSASLNLASISQFSDYASRISAALPSIIVSLVIVIIGIIFSNFIGRVIYLTSKNARITYGDFIARGVRILLIVITFGIVFEYMGLGNNIVTASFLIMFGGIILILSLALGIGLSNVVGDLIRDRLKSMGEKKKDSEP